MTTFDIVYLSVCALFLVPIAVWAVVAWWRLCWEMIRNA